MGSESKPELMYDPMTAGLRNDLAAWLGGQLGQGPQSWAPGVNKMSKAYKALIESTAGKGLEPYASGTIKEMVSTGAPFSETEFFKTAKPVYEQNLENALAQTKETMGMTGSTRATPGEAAMGRTAGEQTNEFMKYMTGVASASHEAAQNRRVGATPLAFEETMLPTKMLGAQAGIGQLIEQMKMNPYLSMMLQLAGNWPQMYQPNEQGLNVGGLMSGAGSMGLGMSQLWPLLFGAGKAAATPWMPALGLIPPIA